MSRLGGTLEFDRASPDQRCENPLRVLHAVAELLHHLLACQSYPLEFWGHLEFWNSPGTPSPELP